MSLLQELIEIRGGAFVMGKDGSRKDESPAHRVLVGAFRAAVSPVTNAEYARFVSATGAQSPPFVREPRFAAPELPVVGISWFDAVAYCDWLAHESGTLIRLPTEAEREFAALGGLEAGDWPWSGPEHPLAGRIAAMEGPHVPSPECSNGYGLRCMAENVHEWCSDWYAADFYGASPPEQPRGPATGVRRASRGGAWRHSVKFTRINARSSLDPTFRYSDYGFRVYADPA